MADPLGHAYLAMFRAKTQMAQAEAVAVEGPAQPVPQAQEEGPMQWIIEGPEAEKLGEGLGVNELNVDLLAETKSFFARIGRGFRGLFGARSVFSAPPPVTSGPVPAQAEKTKTSAGAASTGLLAESDDGPVIKGAVALGDGRISPLGLQALARNGSSPAPAQAAAAEEAPKAKDKDKGQDGPEGGSGITGFMETPPAEPKNPVGGWMGSVSLEGLSLVRNHGEFFPVQPAVNVAQQGAVMVLVPPPAAPAPVMFSLQLVRFAG